MRETVWEVESDANCGVVVNTDMICVYKQDFGLEHSVVPVGVEI